MGGSGAHGIGMHKLTFSEAIFKDTNRCSAVLGFGELAIKKFNWIIRAVPTSYGQDS